MSLELVLDGFPFIAQGLHDLRLTFRMLDCPADRRACGIALGLDRGKFVLGLARLDPLGLDPGIALQPPLMSEGDDGEEGAGG